MYRGHTVGVVIPAYNEESFVGPTIESVPDFVDRVYAVDDGSTDDTWQEIRATSERENERRRRDPDVTLAFDEPIVPITHAENRGVGGAIKTGYLRARDERIDVTLVMGGDGQMEPELAGTLCDPIIDGDADYVKGNRFLDREDRGAMPRFRFVGNAILNGLTKITSGYWRIGDPQSGYTAISLHALETADVDEMYEFYGYCNDLLVKLNVAGLKVLDVPRPIIYGDEESHIRYRTYIPRVSGMLFRNFLWRLRTNYLTFDFHPLVVAYLAGGVATVAGLFGVVRAVAGGGSDEAALDRGLLGVLLGIVGVLSFVGAMVLDKRENDPLNDVLRTRDVNGDSGVPDHQPEPGVPKAEATSPGAPVGRTNGSPRGDEYTASDGRYAYLEAPLSGTEPVPRETERREVDPRPGSSSDDPAA